MVYKSFLFLFIVSLYISLISSPEFKSMLRDRGLTDAQIDYIARCAGKHFEPGLVRRRAKRSDSGYTFGFYTKRRV